MGKRTERWGEGVVYPGQWEKGQARGMDRQTEGMDQRHRPDE